MLDIHFNLFFIFTILFIGIKFVKSFYISLCTFRCIDVEYYANAMFFTQTGY